MIATTTESSADRRHIEYLLLGLLALLWGASYLFAKVALSDIPPMTLAASRVTIAAAVLGGVMIIRGEALPSGIVIWRMLLIQAIFNSIAAWPLLAWGQQHVDAGLASVLNSTSPIFVFLFTALITRHEIQNGRKLLGALIGLGGVILIVGIDALRGLGQEVAGQLACLLGAALYGCAAIYGARFRGISALAVATGTMLLASITLIPIALVVDSPWQLRPSTTALSVTLALGVLSTGLAMLLYFRLIRTLGSLGAASQAYLRAGVGVLLGMLVLGETLSLSTAGGVLLALIGVILINIPRRLGTTQSAP